MGLEEVTVIPTLWLYILGAVNASREDTQIRASVLDVFISSERAHNILQIISESISLVISIWLTYWAWDYFKYSVRVSKETPTLYIPSIIYESALFIGLFLMTFYVLMHLIKHIRSFIKNKPSNNKIIEANSDTNKTNNFEDSKEEEHKNG